MAGAGLYCTKAAPTHNDDTQSGAAAGQVIALTTGGLGVADAFKGGYIENTGGAASSDYQPTATGPTTGGHSWTASSQFQALFAAWKAADDTAATWWLSSIAGPPQWWEYTPDVDVRFVKATLQAMDAGTDGMPKDFVIEGYNGSSWIPLKTVTGEPAWSAAEIREYTWSNPITYQKYRIYITAVQLGNFVGLAEVQWFEFVSLNEIRSIVSHDDDHVTLEGDLTNWDEGDDLDIYDAWDTIQGALDQLWTDQSTAPFTASQYIRVFAGTYDENVVPNAGLNAQYGRALIIEGDPADDRENIILQPSGGSDGLYINCDGVIVVRHLKVDGAALAAESIQSYTTVKLIIVEDCEVIGGSGGTVLNLRVNGVLTDSVVTANGGHGFSGSVQGSSYVARCRFTQAGARGTSFAIYAQDGVALEACTVSGFYHGIHKGTSYGFLRLSNCTVYDCTRGVWLNRPCAYDVSIINTVFHTVPDILYLGNTYGWPQEVADHIGPRVTLRNNCFYTYTNFSNDGVTQKTYAQFAALGRVDSAGDLDVTDPLLTAPATDDFSLQATSPCRHAGHGSRVVADYLGTDFNAYHPDIGGWSSGAATTSPGITSVTATDSAVTVTVTAGSAPYVRAILVDRSGAVIDEQGRLGAGVITLTPSAAGEHHVAAWSANAADEPVGEPTLHPRLVFVLSGAAATYSTIRSLLDVALNSYQASNVAWENTEYEPAVGTGWLRPTFLPAEPEQAELGTEGRNRLQGIYQVSVFAPAGKGSGEAEGRAEDLVAYFKRGKSFTSGDVTVRISRVWRGVAAQEADWFHVPVTIQWFAYVAN